MVGFGFGWRWVGVRLRVKGRARVRVKAVTAATFAATAARVCRSLLGNGVRVRVRVSFAMLRLADLPK